MCCNHKHYEYYFKCYIIPAYIKRTIVSYAAHIDIGAGIVIAFDCFLMFAKLFQKMYIHVTIIQHALAKSVPSPPQI